MVAGLAMTLTRSIFAGETGKGCIDGVRPASQAEKAETARLQAIQRVTGTGPAQVSRAFGLFGLRETSFNFANHKPRHGWQVECHCVFERPQVGERR